MAPIFPNVLPGDLITAFDMNRVLQALSSLDDRVTRLEGSVISGAGVAITDLDPPSGTIKVGDPLTVIGRNFGISTGASRVYIDDLRIDSFLQATDTQLVFPIPFSIVDVPPQGRSATLTVSNATSSAQRTLSLKPALTLGGSALVVSTGIAPPTITAGQPATFSFLLSSRATMDAKFALKATISVVANQDIWQNNLQILDQHQSVVTQLPVAAGQSVPFSVRISPVPPGTDGTAFSLKVDAGADGVTGTSGQIQQTVGTTADQPDNTIKAFAFSSSQVSPANAGSANASEIKLASGGAAKITLAAVFSVQGNYALTPSQIGGASGWQVQPLASTTPSPFPVSAGDLNNPQGQASKTLDFVVTRPNGATSGQIEFKIQRQGQTLSRKFMMTLTAS